MLALLIVKPSLPGGISKAPVYAPSSIIIVPPAGNADIAIIIIYKKRIEKGASD